MAGRILVLDDEENYAEMLQDLLCEHNYRVDMATRPERAISQLEEIPYDLVISDYKMPVMDGADFLRKARELYPNLPFILVSGLMNTPELVKVANMSVTLVMEKPLDTEAFLRHVARFSAPMTDAEREQVGKDEQFDSSSSVALSYPEEPRFFSASNFLAVRFLQNAWGIAKEGRELYILEPTGGDAELALKDLSYWRGNGDMAVDLIQLESSLEDAVSQIRTVLSDFEKSRVLGVRLDSIEALALAQQLTQAVQEQIEGAETLLLVYILSGDGMMAAFEAAIPESGVILPPISRRPSDLAVYARRFARIAAERVGRRRCAEFSPEAIFALLAFDWPGNHRQLQEVLQTAISSSSDEPISLGLVCQAMGVAIDPTAPNGRIANLMKREQCRYLNSQLEQLGLSAAELAKRLELDSSIQTKDDLQYMPLLLTQLSAF
jgi:CheY-like chemotaxis protein